MLSKGMYDRTRIHAGQPKDKPKTGPYWGKARVVQDMTGYEFIRYVRVGPALKEYDSIVNITIFQLP